MGAAQVAAVRLVAIRGKVVRTAAGVEVVAAGAEVAAAMAKRVVTAVAPAEANPEKESEVVTAVAAAVAAGMEEMAASSGLCWSSSSHPSVPLG